MDRARRKRQLRLRAHRRVRNKIAGTKDKPRLAVFKSARYVYAQVIDDTSGRTLAQANSGEAEIGKKLEGAGSKTRAAARLVGEKVAARAKEQGIERVVFDRGGFIYHGRIREVAEGARAEGLQF